MHGRRNGRNDVKMYEVVLTEREYLSGAATQFVVCGAKQSVHLSFVTL